MLGRKQRMTTMIIFCVALILAGCSGAAATNTPSVTATPAIIVPTFSFTQPTAPPQVATAAVTRTVSTSRNAFDLEAVERGRGRYEALECATCHGANGEGGDFAGQLIGYNADEADFITFMRSGGALGTGHQYATNRLSASGATNLYQYLRSLQAP